MSTLISIQDGKIIAAEELNFRICSIGDDKVSEAITGKTKVVVTVDLGGIICDYDKLYQRLRAREINLFLSPEALWLLVFNRQLGGLLFFSIVPMHWVLLRIARWSVRLQTLLISL